MSAGELAFLALVGGGFAAFMVSVMWLRADYVKLRDGRQAAAARLQPQMAE